MSNKLFQLAFAFLETLALHNSVHICAVEDLGVVVLKRGDTFEVCCAVQADQSSWKLQ